MYQLIIFLAYICSPLALITHSTFDVTNINSYKLHFIDRQAVVTMYNFQKYCYISPPGWTLSWFWANNEVIWNMFGGQATEKGNCSRYKTAPAVPHCCKNTPTVVDLSPEAPYNQQVPNCCKGGVISVWGLDPNSYISSFQITVGESGNTNYTIKVPKNFTLLAPGPAYNCGPAVVTKPTKFITPDGRRITQAMMTWYITCTYAQFIIGVPTHDPGSCVKNSPYFSGGNCVMPPSMPPSYAPYQDLPNASSSLSFSLLALLTACLFVFFVFV
ncbi:hypothetical protein HanPI659440_Chr00c04g0711651 [Helianthus annuus]|nr:hypothetical protein HanPI659440_Chr00c04g0711651 [Helianthus annuus]